MRVKAKLSAAWDRNVMFTALQMTAELDRW